MITIKKEKWETLDFEIGYENFMISNYGKVKNKRTNKILKPDISTEYQRVNLYNSVTKKQKKFAIHILVARYFVKGYKECLIVNHKDGNKHNNYYENLEWTTYSGNLKHAFSHNLRENNKGTNNPGNVYSDEIIHSICKLIEKGLTTKDISIKIFGQYILKYKNLINHIKGKRRWTHISNQYNF